MTVKQAAIEVLKKAKPRDEAAIEDAVYDLKAVNPHKKPVVDTRTPEELMDIIETKGQEVAEALAALRGNALAEEVSP